MKQERAYQPPMEQIRVMTHLPQERMHTEDNEESKQNTKANGSTSKAADDDEDFGGLMSTIKKSNAKKDKKKKNKKQQDDDIWDELGEDVSGNAAGNKADADSMDVDKQPSGPIEASVEDEFPDPKAEKKNKKNKGNTEDGDGAGSGAATPAADGEDDSTPRILSKKEKEKLKKEKEKAKKKAQAAAKKATTGGDEIADVATESKQEDTSIAEQAADEDDAAEDGEEGGASAADKKKKKKKKGAASKPEPTPAPTTKKPSAAVQALQARIAAQRKAEEEAKAAEEEARRKEEEAERLEKEEADRKEAERQRRKEKEKAKKEQLKREGKLLTPKQKAEKAAAEARMQALIKSGTVKVEGLANRGEGSSASGEQRETKRAVADSRNRKKKGPSGPPSKLASNLLPEQPVEEKAVEETPAAVEAESVSIAEPVTEPEPAKEEAIVEDVKDSWDAESDHEDVKDDWDVESEEEKPAEKTKPAEAKPTNGKPVEAPVKSASTTAAKAKAPAATEKEGEESDDDSEDEEDESDSEDDSSDDHDSEDEMTVAQKMAAERKAEAEKRRLEKHQAALAARSKDDLRSPICCIMGHVDTGKTKLLDKIRQTNVQEGEAGGITQQIGATYFPEDTLRQKIAPIDPEGKQDFNIPGLLVIDTPGHESFTNLRTRGSSLCNIAVLVVDIMHGLEQQTLESIRLLRDKKTPFIVALNKIDRLYGWQSTPDGAFRPSLANQNRATQNEFQDRVDKTIVAFAEQGLNAVLYYDNKNFAKNVSLVPTSAHTGEGIPDMLQLLINLTQERMSEKLMYLSELECTVLEVKVIEGLGTTIDVILSNGVMYEGDKIVLCGLNGPIITQVRALLTPQPLKEMRVKGSYVHHKMVKAALGVKISAPDLEKAIAGSRLMVVGPDDDEEEMMEEVMSDLTGLLHSIDKSGRGVSVQASTLGSLEALLEFLKQSKIPVNGINIGPVYKRDVMRCATMLEKSPDLAVMLCFDVEIDKDAEKLAEEMGVKIFSARIIYHLFDNFIAHQKRVLETKQKESADAAVWPCRLKVLAVFAKRSPLILGCEITAGDLRMGTPIGVKNKETGEIVNLGRVTSLEVNHKRLDVVTAKTAGAGVAVRIECAVHETPKMYGRHFTDQDELFSLVSRKSIDTLKELFWDGVSIEQKKTIKYLKGVLGIP
jgi:translation initiation factor 5B